MKREKEEEEGEDVLYMYLNLFSKNCVFTYCIFHKTVK